MITFFRTHNWNFPLRLAVYSFIMAASALLFSGCGGDYLFIGKPPASTDNKADFIIDGLSMNITRAGRPIQELKSKSAILKATEGLIEMQNVTVLIFNENNEVEGTLVADEGVVFITESYDRNKNDVDLTGDVKYDGLDGTFFRTDRVNFYNESDLVKSDTPVEQGRPLDDSLVTMHGSGFESDRWFRNIKTFSASMKIMPQSAGNQQ